MLDCTGRVIYIHSRCFRIDTKSLQTHESWVRGGGDGGGGGIKNSSSLWGGEDIEVNRIGYLA